MLGDFGGSWSEYLGPVEEVVQKYGLSPEQKLLFLGHIEDLILAGEGNDVQVDATHLDRNIALALDEWVERVYA